jgi:hypothetical protein
MCPFMITMYLPGKASSPALYKGAGASYITKINTKIPAETRRASARSNTTFIG